jgi:hypothetical protein
MKFAVRLKGATNVLEDVADCFQGHSAKIRRLEDGWFLESSAFDACTSEAEVVGVAQTILLFVHRVCVMYVQLYSPFTIGGVNIFSDNGVLLNRTLRDTTQITVYSPNGLQELQNPSGDGSLGSAVVGAAMKNEGVREALAMLGDLEWPQLYNILEFLVDADACAATSQHQGHRTEDQKILEHCFPPTPRTEPTLQYRMVALGPSLIRSSAWKLPDPHYK